MGPEHESDQDRADRWDRSSSAMEGLAAANTASNQTMLNLVEQVRRESEARERKIEVMAKTNQQTRVLTYILCAVTAIMLVLAVVNAFNIASTRDEQRSIESINRTLLDCVNATGECGQINQQTQKQFLDEVKKYNLIGFYCIRNNPGTADPKAEKFLECMQRLYPGGPTLSER